jgi:hypothetical protein
MTLEILNIVIFEFVELVVEFLMILEPELHHGWAIRPLLV